MNKITGVHSVDFKIEATGHGCINWNGSVSLMGDNGKEVKNHSVPKMRGWTNKSGKVKDENGYEYKVGVHDIDMKNTPMYISQNCLKHHIFKRDMPFHLGKLLEKHAEVFLRKPTGLLRGYAITAQTPLMKKSPVLLEDLYDELGNCNFEVLSTATSKEYSETGGFYSKTTVGNTRYVGYGSINIEELQFVSCDGLFGRSAIGLSLDENEVKQLACDMTVMLRDTANELEISNMNPVAEYNECWVRDGSLMAIGEAGILLNNDALFILVKYFEKLLISLFIHQARGWMQIDDLKMDFNDSGKRFRMKPNDSLAEDFSGKKFVVYYRKGSDLEKQSSKWEKELLSGAASTRKTRKSKKSDSNKASTPEQKRVQEIQDSDV